MVTNDPTSTPTNRITIDESRSMSAMSAILCVVAPAIAALMLYGGTGRMAWALLGGAGTMLLFVLCWRAIVHRVELEGNALEVQTNAGVHVFPVGRVTWSAVVPLPLNFSFLMFLQRDGAWMPFVAWAGAMETSAGGCRPTIGALRDILNRATASARQLGASEEAAAERIAGGHARRSLGGAWPRWMASGTTRRQRAAMLARPSLSRGEFVACFPGSEREAEVVFEALRPQIFVEGFSPNPDDDLDRIYELALEELEDFVLDAFKSLGYPVPPPKDTVGLPPVKSVRDAVQFLSRFRSAT